MQLDEEKFRENICLKFGGLFIIEKGEKENNICLRKPQSQTTVLFKNLLNFLYFFQTKSINRFLLKKKI